MLVPRPSSSTSMAHFARYPTRAAAASRLFSTSTSLRARTAPCNEYMAVTHPDAASSPDSSVAKTLARFDKATLATYARPSVLLTRGKGLDLWAKIDPTSSPTSSTERHYLDFSSGICVNSLGHADDEIARIAGEQASQLVHSSNLYHNEWSGELADRMVQMTREHGGLGVEAGSKEEGGEGLKVFLANSGTEANEAALKFARKYSMITANKGPGEKSALVSFHNAFHGRTMGALSMTPNPKYQAPFAPLIGDVHTGHYNCSTSDLQTLITEKTAGVIVEPVQGEGGIYPANVEWLKALRKRCDEVGALLIFDEIQCGLWRSGTLWCHSKMPIEAHPDIVTMAKPLANGFPIGAVLMRGRVAEAIAVGDHGTTFGGGPLTSRVAHHVLGRLADEGLRQRMGEASKRLFARLEQLRDWFPDLVAHDEQASKAGDVTKRSPRGKGLLVGLSMREAADAGKVVKMARERGLIVLSAGKDALRLTPSLTVSVEQVDRAVDVLESCFLVLREEKGSKA